MALGSGKDLVPLSPALHGAGFFFKADRLRRSVRGGC